MEKFTFIIQYNVTLESGLKNTVTHRLPYLACIAKKHYLPSLGHIVLAGGKTIFLCLVKWICLSE